MSLYDNSLYQAYALNAGMYYNGDSWVVIERLTPEFDTISTLFYGTHNDNVCDMALSVVSTKEDGLILLTTSYDVNYTNYNCSINKFPAEAFVGIDEAHDSGLKVAIAYPNPGKDVLNIRMGLKDAWVEVYDLNGRLVHRQDITENVTGIDAGGWAAGSYIWKVYTLDGGPSTLRPGSATSGSTTLAETGKWVKE